MNCYKCTTYCVSSAPVSRKCHNERCERYLSDNELVKAREGDYVVAWGDFHNSAYGLKCPRFIASEKSLTA